MTDSTSADASLGYLGVSAMDMFERAGAAVVEPPADPRLAPGWALRAYITGKDAIFRDGGALEVGEGRVYYGFLLERTTAPSQWVAVIRGTADILEWIEDAEFAQVPHPLGGKVEAGFYGLYETLSLRPPGGMDVTLVDGIASTLGKDGTLTVIGHSLGAALATYLTLECAQKIGADRVAGRFFASPRPGDAAFAAMYDERVHDHETYVYELDAVPHVPLGLGYCHLSAVTTLSPHFAQARIAFSLACGHHLACYLAMMFWALLDWASLPAIDAEYAACIKGPRV